MRPKSSTLLAILVCQSMQGLALGSEESEKLEMKAGLQGNLSLTHSVGANTSSDPTSSALAELKYNVNSEQSLLLRQEVSKLYLKDRGEEDWQAADTYLAFRLRKASSWQDLSFGATVSATLPASPVSQKQEILSIPGLALQATQKLFSNRLVVSGGPFYRYHINRYKSMKDDDSGRYLIRSRYGFDLSAQAVVSEKFSLATAVQWAERTYEQAPYGTVSSDHRYNVDVSASYELDKKSALTLGYAQTDLAEQLGRIDVYLFDTEVSSYYAQLSYQVF